MRGDTSSACSAITGRLPDPSGPTNAEQDLNGRQRLTSFVGEAGYARFMDALGSTEAAIYLRSPIEADREAFVALRRASAKSLGQWEPRMGNAEEQFGDQSFDRLLGRRDSEADEPFLIHRASDGEIVGYVGLAQIFRGPFRSCIMGYWIGDPYLGRGYGTAGVRACLGTAFAHESKGGLGLHRAEANTIPLNEASLAVVRRAGMRKEGYSPGYLEIDGEWRDHERWAITAEDWNAASSSLANVAGSAMTT